MSHLRFILLAFAIFTFGCGKGAPSTTLDENTSKKKEDAEHRAKQQAEEMSKKYQGGPPLPQK